MFVAPANCRARSAKFRRRRRDVSHIGVRISYLQRLEAKIEEMRAQLADAERRVLETGAGARHELTTLRREARCSSRVRTTRSSWRFRRIT